MSDWQPITTAPKDGTPILATQKGYAYTLNRCKVVFWDDEADAVGWHIPEDDEGFPSHSWLTHWMPLPGPPK